MTLIDYLRTLTAKEREELAIEIDVSKGYLRQLSWDKKRLASVDLAKKVQRSKFNGSLPLKARFSNKDYLLHREACFIRKSVGGDK